MKTVSMLKFRRDAEGVLKQVARGHRFLLTYRGKPVARLEPVSAKVDADNDPIYGLADLASDKAEPLSNAQMDRIVYGG